MSYNKAYRIKDDNGVKSIGEEIKFVAYGVDVDIDEEALKVWANSQFLKLVGGTLTGNLSCRLDITKGEVPEETLTARYSFTDNAGQLLGSLLYNSTPDDLTQLILRLYQNREGSEFAAGFGVVRAEGNGGWYAIGPNPNNDVVPDNALQTKKSVTDNFLPRTGGEMSGAIDCISNNLSTVEGEWPATSNYYNAVNFYDKHKNFMGALQSQVYSDGEVRHNLANGRTINGVYKAANLTVNLKEDGTGYASCPPPRGLYNNDIATFNSLVDYAPQTFGGKDVNFHIDANIGSDTADLHDGRGLSAEKPFKSFSAAYPYSYKFTCNGVNTVFMLHTDIHISLDYFIRYQSGNRMIITSYDKNNPVTVTFDKDLIITNNSVEFSYVNVNLMSHKIKCGGMYDSNSFLMLYDIGFTGSAMQLLIENSAMILSRNVSFSGTASPTGLLYVTRGGLVAVDVAPTGNVTGKRFALVQGGRVFTGGKGVNVIPGTEAGTTDASSIYA